MEFAEQEVKKYHEELWDWLSKNPCEEKYSWPGWINYKFFIDDIESDCFLCEFYGERDNNNEMHCNDCPLFCEDGLKKYKGKCATIFFKWQYCDTYPEAILSARLIRDVFKRQEARNG